MTTTTPDPIENNVERVLVRNTATGFEQGIAAVAGLFTCGPVGALASWGTIRGLQGKWAPWFIIGVPAAVAINIVNIGALAVLNSGDSTPTPAPAPSVSELVTPSNSSLPSYNVSTVSGGTTLVQKCTELAAAQESLNLGKVAAISFTIGSEHDTPWTTNVDQDCATVGVNTNL